MSDVDQTGNERKPTYKVEYYAGRWRHRVWRKNELSAKVIAEVESKSRHRAMRVKHEGHILYQYSKEGVAESGDNISDGLAGRGVSGTGGRSRKGKKKV